MDISSNHDVQLIMCCVGFHMCISRLKAHSCTWFTTPARPLHIALRMHMHVRMVGINALLHHDYVLCTLHSCQPNDYCAENKIEDACTKSDVGESTCVWGQRKCY